MRKIFLIIAAFLFSGAVIAQVPHLFKYQGLARDSSGNPLSNLTIALRIKIHQASPTGTVVYEEVHNPVVTNEFGSFSINIGGGSPITGNFSTIPWSRYNFFQQVEMDVSGGTNFISMGTSQYLSVPYAFAADSALFGIAPFRVSNSLDDTTEAAVAIIATANTTGDGAPAIWAKNLGTGPALLVDGHSILSGSVFVNDSLLVNGKSQLSGNVEVNGNINVSQTIKANGVIGTSGQVLGANSSGDLAWLNVARGFSNFQVFNSSGTFTIPVGITKVMVELWGGGGGGGGGGSSDSTYTFGGMGGGAGGGGYVKDILNVSPGGSISIIVGNGGNGGAGGCGNCGLRFGYPGNNGGSTSFGVASTAGGGIGGIGGSAGTTVNGNNGQGGAGGNAPGILGIAGQPGQSGDFLGYGGSSPNGGFGGNPGGNKTPGGGGSGGPGRFGGVNGDAGSNGGNGRLIVWW
jgi:hypothetical protein